MNKTIINALKIKDQFYKLNIKYRNNTYYKTNFINWRNKSDYLIRTAKQKYYIKKIRKQHEQRQILLENYK